MSMKIRSGPKQTNLSKAQNSKSPTRPGVVTHVRGGGGSTSTTAKTSKK